MEGRAVVGIDIGGTKTLSAVVDAQGRVLARRRIETPQRGPADFVQVLARELSTLRGLAGLQKEDLLGLGVGAPGPLAPGQAIARMAEEAVQAGRQTRLAGLPPGALTAAVVAQAALDGDAVAREIYARAGHHIGIAVASLVNVLNPAMVVFGGGVSKVGDLLFDTVRRVGRGRGVERPAQAPARLLPRLPPRHPLRDQRVVMRRDGVAGVGVGVHPDARAAGGEEGGDHARRGAGVVARALRVDAP